MIFQKEIELIIPSASVMQLITLLYKLPSKMFPFLTLNDSF